MKIQQMVLLAEGRIWEQVAARCSARGEASLFWELATIYCAPLTSMRAKSIWTHIAFPIITKGDNKCEWFAASSLGELTFPESGGPSAGRFKRCDGSVIEFPVQVSKWIEGQNKVSYSLNELLLSTCTLVADATGIRFVPSYPAEQESALDEFEMSGSFLGGVHLLPYGGDLSPCICCHTDFRTANRMHPLARKALESNFLQQPSSLHKFASSLVWLLSENKKEMPQMLSRITLESMLQAPLKNFSLQYKYNGSLFRDIDWQSVSSDCYPPYLVRLESGKVVHVTAEILERWAGMKDR